MGWQSSPGRVNRDEASQRIRLVDTKEWTRCRTVTRMRPGTPCWPRRDEAWKDDPALDSQALGDGSGGDSVSCYLRAYYQRIATEDLAPPSRLAAVAEAHARLGLRRPQGRALVQVREPDDAHLNPVSRSGLVVDIVTDDMPYLVDSVTTELNRHEAEILLLVHPLLRVRRDVTGALRAILGVCGDGSDPGRRTADEHDRILDPRRARPARDRVTRRPARGRPAPRAGRRAGGRRGPAADGLGGPPPGRRPRRRTRQRSGRARRPAALAGATATSLFLGYREYDLVRAEDGAGLRAVPGTGLGILRHARQGRESLRKLSTQVAARAQDPAERLVLAKANSRSTVYRANYLDYVSVKKLGPDGDGHRGVQVPRPVHARGAHRAHHRHSGAPAQAGPGPGRRPGCRRTATTGRTWSRYSRTSRARSCSRSRPKSSPRSRSACCG